MDMRPMESRGRAAMSAGRASEPSGGSRGAFGASCLLGCLCLALRGNACVTVGDGGGGGGGVWMLLPRCARCGVTVSIVGSV